MHLILEPSKKRTTWTKKEQKVVLDKLSMYPTNIQFACKQAAEDLGRTYLSVYNHYYSVLRKNTPALGIVTKTGVAETNVKNTPFKKEEDDSLRMDVLQNLLKRLTREQKKQVVDWILVF